MDKLGRKFKKLRVSLTDQCNFSCAYCVADDQDDSLISGLHKSDPQLPILRDKQPLQYHELISIIKQLHLKLKLETIHLTGGEPLLYSDIFPLLEELFKLEGLQISLTTNGFYLANFVKKLKSNYRFKTINVSLDAIDEEVFFHVTRRKSLNRVFMGVDSAIKAGIPLKINTVVMKGVNDREILPLLEWGMRKGVPVRFLELMKMGHLYRGKNDYYYSSQEILHQIQQHYSITPTIREKGATSNYWELSNGYQFGIIGNESLPFCGDCNRLRLDAYGNIFGCLSSDVSYDIKEAIDKDNIELALHRAMQHKQPVRFKGSDLGMMDIGG